MRVLLFIKNILYKWYMFIQTECKDIKGKEKNLSQIRPNSMSLKGKKVAYLI